MADEVVINPADTEMIGFGPFGELFANARNAKKLALKDVSNNLRLSIKQIEALENNDFANIELFFVKNVEELLSKVLLTT